MLTVNQSLELLASNVKPATLKQLSNRLLITPKELTDKKLIARLVEYMYTMDVCVIVLPSTVDYDTGFNRWDDGDYQVGEIDSYTLPGMRCFHFIIWDDNRKKSYYNFTYHVDEQTSSICIAPNPYRQLQNALFARLSD